MRAGYLDIQISLVHSRTCTQAVSKISLSLFSHYSKLDLTTDAIPATQGYTMKDLSYEDDGDLLVTVTDSFGDELGVTNTIALEDNEELTKMGKIANHHDKSALFAPYKANDKHLENDFTSALQPNLLDLFTEVSTAEFHFIRHDHVHRAEMDRQASDDHKCLQLVDTVKDTVAKDDDDEVARSFLASSIMLDTAEFQSQGSLWVWDDERGDLTTDNSKNDDDNGEEETGDVTMDTPLIAMSTDAHNYNYNYKPSATGTMQGHLLRCNDFRCHDEDESKVDVPPMIGPHFLATAEFHVCFE
jgi:hypothetical protein